MPDTPLIKAVKDEDMATVRRLASTDQLNKGGEYGRRPLHWAARYGRREAAQVLVDHKADVNSTDDNGGNTPLQQAAYKGHTTIAQFLLKNKAQVNAVDEWKWTPLIYAARMGHPDTVQSLLASNADPDLRDDKGKTALDYAKERKKTKVVQVLEQAHPRRLNWTMRCCSIVAQDLQWGSAMRDLSAHVAEQLSGLKYKHVRNRIANSAFTNEWFVNEPASVAQAEMDAASSSASSK